MYCVLMAYKKVKYITKQHNGWAGGIRSILLYDPYTTNKAV